MQGRAELREARAVRVVDLPPQGEELGGEEPGRVRGERAREALEGACGGRGEDALAELGEERYEFCVDGIC